MENSLIECIPNFSDAVRPEIIQQIVETIQNVGNINVLDLHSDLDHNRSVVTFIGCPEDVEEAAFQAIKKASELIDLNIHRGGHPRIGATDVVPFVPIQNASMEDCIQIARRLAQRVGEGLGIPAYLYEEAAQTPERQNLETIRRGQYEGLKDAIRTDPSRKPDFGPSELGPAGATVIGARQPLIAFNVYLTTGDIKIAQNIARAVRHSSGGFRFVKAMGILVEGHAQVSMNLTSYKQTPIARVVEAIRREAGRYGVGIHHSELVGMLPQEALLNAAQWYLQLDGFEPDQVLENKLYRCASNQRQPGKPNDFIEELASATPTPGGGAAAAYSGAEAAALVSMVCRLTVGKKKYADVETRMVSILEESEKIRNRFSEAVDKDVDAFNHYIKTVQMPKNTPEEINLRDQALEAAALQAARVPFDVASDALALIKLAQTAAEIGNINAISDAGSAAALCKATFVSAALNVRINLIDKSTNPEAAAYLKNLSAMEKEISLEENKMLSILKQRSRLELNSL